MSSPRAGVAPSARNRRAAKKLQPARDGLVGARGASSAASRGGPHEIAAKDGRAADPSIPARPMQPITIAPQFSSSAPRCLAVFFGELQEAHRFVGLGACEIGIEIVGIEL